MPGTISKESRSWHRMFAAQHTLCQYAAPLSEHGGRQQSLQPTWSAWFEALTQAGRSTRYVSTGRGIATA
eukprot:1197180-Rhodomonas_salina.3